jgi:hypothetical protein
MLRRLGALLWVMALLGCAARGTIATPDPIATNLDAYSRLAVDVVSAVEDDVEEESVRLRDRIVEEVQKAGRFTDVQPSTTGSAPQGSLRLIATITDIRKVNAGQRFFGGVFAGRARVILRVQLVEMANGAILHEQEVTGESGGSGMSGGTNDALTQAARAIAKWLSPQA